MNHRTVIFAAAVIGVCFALTTVNPLLTILAVASFGAIVLITWRPGEVPGLTFACLMQWVSSAVAILRADYQGTEVWKLSFTAHYEDALGLSLMAVVAFAIGGRIALGWGGTQITGASLSSPGLDRRLLIMWIASNVIASGVTILDQGGFSQLVRAVQQLKWAPVFVLFMVVLSRGRNYALLVIVVVAEIGVGFLSFFSQFKTPLYLLAIALVGSQRVRVVTPKQLIGAIMVGAFAIGLAVVWSAVKVDYRYYQNQGTGAQVTKVSKERQADKFIDLVTELDAHQLDGASNALADRLAYVEYFAAAMDYVPAIQPHEDGGRIIAALKHVLMPRLFFPNKAALNDTADTERYTGFSLDSASMTTSISLGYPAEAYVDAGAIFMFVPIMFFGLLFGGVARRLMSITEDKMLGTAIGVIVLISASSLELGFTKMLGGTLTMAIGFELVLRIVGSRLSPWLWGTPPKAAQASEVLEQHATLAR